MVAALALYTSLENDFAVVRGINEMVYLAYENTFEDPHNTDSNERFQGPAEQVTPWGGIPAPGIRDFDLLVIVEDRKVYIKLSFCMVRTR